MTGGSLSIDTRAAEAREKYLEPIFGPWAQEVVDRAALRPGQDLLDVGCGTGPATRIAAKQLSSASRVVGLDIDPVRLALARSLAERDGMEIEWLEGSALELPFEANTFDVALCCLTLQFLPDRKKGLQEMRRVLKPEGRLVASVWRSVEHCPGYLAFSEAMAAASGKEQEAMPPFSLGDADELQTLARSAGFTNVQVHQAMKISRFASASQFVKAIATGAATTRRAFEAFEAQTRERIGSAVSTSLRKFEDADGLALPMEANILVAAR